MVWNAHSSAAAVCLLAAFLLSSCATTRVNSVKAQGYNNEPRRLFLIAGPMEFGVGFADAFETRFSSIVRDCGATVQVSRMSSLELDESVHFKRMQAFKADTLLVVRRTGGTKDQYGNILQANYDFRLIDVASNKMVWRSDVNFSRGSVLNSDAERAESLVLGITNKMKEDGIFRSCPAITKSALP